MKKPFCLSLYFCTFGNTYKHTKMTSTRNTDKTTTKKIHQVFSEVEEDDEDGDTNDDKLDWKFCKAISLSGPKGRWFETQYFLIVRNVIE